ncbi:MAG: bifunctional demethylmenaquinone methyltransferase/2-methoxy-6-polyprenyl-1,4-benzoquinol methylase UbiE [Desulfobacterales bacterium]
MRLGKQFWVNSHQRRQQLDEAVRQRRQANFGFEQVPEAEKVHRVRYHFNSVAQHYDFMNTLLSFGIHLIWKVMAVKELGLGADQKVLDVCGGTGDLARLAARKVGPGGRVTIYDINWEMMAAGRPRIASGREGRQINFVQGNAESLCFPDQVFDVAMVGFGIRNVTHMVQGFQEMYRVLKPGGRFLCLEFSKPRNPVFRALYDFYSFAIMPLLGELIAGSRQAYTHLPETIRLFPLPDELAAILREIGFSPVGYRSLTNGIAMIHYGRKPNV